MAIAKKALAAKGKPSPAVQVKSRTVTKPVPKPVVEPEPVEVEQGEVPEVVGELESLLGTEALASPPKTPDSHTVSITTTEIKPFDSGGAGLQITLNSEQTGSDMTYMVFFPAGFVEDIHVNPADLPEDPGDPDNGIPKNKQQSGYGRAVQNKEGTSDVQRLVNLAREQGSTFSSIGASAPETFEEFCDNLSGLLIGLRALVLRQPQKTDDEFNGQLKVRQVRPISDQTNPKLTKLFSKYHCLWA